MPKYSLAKTLNIEPERVERITTHQSYKETLLTFVSILEKVLLNTIEDMNKIDEVDDDNVNLRDLYIYRKKSQKHWQENLRELN